MQLKPKDIQKTYLTLTLLNTLATSFIWGINTIFLLNAGLTNVQAFAANAFFTAGEVIFQVPTGIIADMWGRRISYLLGTVTLGISTIFYLFAWKVHAQFFWWAATSMFLGLGFTFFSGATEAWLVDALVFTGFKGGLDSVLAKGQIVGGVAMLTGSVAGGFIAQITNLGVPYILRAIMLGVTFVVAFFKMADLGFKPSESRHPFIKTKEIFSTSIKYGLKNPPVRWLMLAAPFTMGVSFYAFYAMQPYLLKLWGDPKAYGIAGLVAAIVACAQIAGGFAVPHINKVFSKRTSFLILNAVLGSTLLIGAGLIQNFWIFMALLVVWGLLFSALMPVRQAYLNGLIPTEARATVLSFDSLMGSSGGVFIQPILGKVADASGYPLSYIGGAVFQIFALPFIILARRENPKSDPV